MAKLKLTEYEDGLYALFRQAKNAKGALQELHRCLQNRREDDVDFESVELNKNCELTFKIGGNHYLFRSEGNLSKPEESIIAAYQQQNDSLEFLCKHPSSKWYIGQNPNHYDFAHKFLEVFYEAIQERPIINFAILEKE